MFPYFTLFGRQIYLYPLMGMLGIAAGTLFAARRGRGMGIGAFHWLSLALYGALGAMLGAKLLFLLTQMEDIAREIRASAPVLYLLRKYFLGGFVFYGGLLGAFVGLALYCRYMSLPTRQVMYQGAVVLPLIHGFGRLGCFFAGCCYGIPWAPPLGVAFRFSLSAPNHQHLFPVQLVEAVLLFAIFALQWLYTRRERTTGQVVCRYLLLYAPLRFVLEFFRGDSVRGFLWGVSTSQWFSVLLVAGVLLYRLWQRNVPRSC